MAETFDVCMNGKWITARKFNKGERVKNQHGDSGTVINTENNMFVNVDWDEKESLGRTWTATNLSLVN